MQYLVDLDEQQYAMLCSDAIQLSAKGRHDVWSALPVSGRWWVRTGEREAAEMRDVFRIRGMVDAMATIDHALAAPRSRGARLVRTGPPRAS